MNVTFTRREISADGAADAGVSSPMVSPGMLIDTVLRIDGRERRVSHDIRASLLDTLREHLGLTHEKQGCGHGQCGACTVHIGGMPRRSCLTLTVAAQGQEITTIERLAPADSELHPMPPAFIDCDGFQSSHSTPASGM